MNTILQTIYNWLEQNHHEPYELTPLDHANRNRHYQEAGLPTPPYQQTIRLGPWNRTSTNTYITITNTTIIINHETITNRKFTTKTHTTDLNDPTAIEQLEKQLNNPHSTPNK